MHRQPPETTVWFHSLYNYYFLWASQMPVIILPPVFSHPSSPLVKSVNNCAARACQGPLVRPPTSSERVPITNWPVGDTIPSHLRVCFLRTTPNFNCSKSGSLETDERWRLARKGLIGISVTSVDEGAQQDWAEREVEFLCICKQKSVSTMEISRAGMAL